MLTSAPKGAKRSERTQIFVKKRTKVMFLFVFMQPMLKVCACLLHRIHHQRPRPSPSRAQPANLTASAIPATAFHRKVAKNRYLSNYHPKTLFCEVSLLK